MKDNGRSGTLLYLFAHWPRFALLYAGLIGCLLFIGLSAEWGGLAFVPFMTAVFGFFLYFILVGIWAASQVYGRGGLLPHHVLFDMGQLQAEDQFLYLDLGYRRRAFSLSRRLTSGKVLIVDLYDPQWTPSPALARWRKRMPPAPDDVRFVWKAGSVNLLPWSDGTLSAVIVCQVLSEFFQEGDRRCLLQEIYRVLAPDGRLLVAEQVRSRTNWFVWGPGALALPTAVYWRTLLQEAGFQLQREENLYGLITCWRADKPTALETRQLTFNLNLSEPREKWE